MTDLVDLLHIMVDQDASDLFLTVGAPVNIKVDGVTRPLNQTPLPAGAVRELVYAVMRDPQIRDFEASQECNFALSQANFGRFRVNLFYQRGEVAAVIRFLKSKIPAIEELGLPEALKDLVMSPRGLFLVVGAAGSGKSTTLASMIDHRAATRTGHILTIEDPIEYAHHHQKSMVNQREIGLDTESYASALRNAMREAPDVILIGEIRDMETMRHAIAYADTGHLCLSTLHANNAYQALERVVNFFPEHARGAVLDDLAMNLRGIFSQRLMVGKDGKRLPAVELMLPSPYIVDLIQKGDFDLVRDAMAQAQGAGMLTFEQTVFDAYMAGRIDYEEALRNSDSRGNMQARIRLAEGSLGEGNFRMETRD